MPGHGDVVGAVDHAVEDRQLPRPGVGNSEYQSVAARLVVMTTPAPARSLISS